MLSIFSIPKPFVGQIAVIQRNAIQSWLRVAPKCEVILCGDEEGAEEVSKELDTMFIPGVARNGYGTPLISSVFDMAERNASRSILCYVNADIILTSDFIAAVRAISFPDYLIVGRRWDVTIEERWNFDEELWEERLRSYVAAYGVLHPPTGIDYFVFPRGSIGTLPPFAVGRPGWDNWMVYRARAAGVPVIDATPVTTVVHQNHDYAHVRDAADHTTEGPEAVTNRQLIDGWDKVFDVRDATHVLKRAVDASPQGACVLHRNWRTVPVPLLRARKKLGYLAGAGARVLRRRLAS